MDRGLGVLVLMAGLGLVYDGLSRERASGRTGLGILLILTGSSLMLEPPKGETP